MINYLPRVADKELAELMQVFGAVLIEGPKACGKTETASRLAATKIRMDEHDQEDLQRLGDKYFFDRQTPILFDEWQAVPRLWNMMRRAVDDANQQEGLFLLTGSATPRDDANRHSGAGRFGVLRLRPMSLYESGHSSGEVSLAALIEGKHQNGEDNGMKLPELLERIVIGGWPKLLGADEKYARRHLKAYLENIVEVDIPSFVGKRDPNALMRTLRSLARFTAQSPAITEIAADIGGESGAAKRETVKRYLDALERVHLLDNSEPWQPHMRSKARLRTAPTRYFVDPSIGTAALGISSEKLLNDLSSAGYHFEALAMRDLRIYAQALGGEVSTWRAEKDEVDAIITLGYQRWAAVEIKMNPSEVDKAAARLLKFAQEKVNTDREGKPSALIVVTAVGRAGQRRDGVHITPITALGP